MSSVSAILLLDSTPKVNQIRSNNHHIKFECDPTNGSKDIAPTDFSGGHFFKCPRQSSCFKCFFFQKLIRSSEISRKPPHPVRMRSNQRFIRYHTQKLFGRPFFQNVLVSHFIFNEFFPKVNKIIRNTPRTTLQN